MLVHMVGDPLGHADFVRESQNSSGLGILVICPIVMGDLSSNINPFFIIEH